MVWLADHWFEISVIALLGAIMVVLVLDRLESAERWERRMPDIVHKVACASEEPLYRITASVERIEDAVQDIEREIRIRQTAEGRAGGQNPALSVVPPASQVR